VDGISLRTIGNAELVHEQNYPGALTSDAVPDIYAFAAQLARDGQLVEPKTWFSKFDEGFNLSSKFPSTIVDPAAAGAVAPINPKFQGTPLAFAVALFPKGTHVSTLPSTVPLAWTRGLQTDGTWRKDSPYGGVGGFVFFLGNNLTYFKGSTASNGGLTTLKGQSTTNILETLPPGTRISEFQGPPKTR
jgi:hypothetical protein